MAVTHTDGELSPLHYLALARETNEIEIPDLGALFDAGVTQDETRLFMRVRMHPDGRLVAEPSDPQSDMYLPWALGNDILLLELSDFEIHDGAAIWVEICYCPDDQGDVEYHVSARSFGVPEVLSPYGPVTDLDLIWTSLSSEETRGVIMQAVVEMVDALIKQLGER